MDTCIIRSGLDYRDITACRYVVSHMNSIAVWLILIDINCELLENITYKLIYEPFIIFTCGCIFLDSVQIILQLPFAFSGWS